MSLKVRARRGLAFTLAAGLITPGLAALAAAPAQAATVSVDDVQFRWGFTNEANARAFAPGTYNHFAAGKLGNPGAGGQTLSAADQGATWANGAAAGWSATAGKVSIEKKQADGAYAATTWAGLSTAPDGSPISFTKFSDHQVVIGKGAGTLDAAADDAKIAWDGDFTVVSYSGMSFFYVSDPTLTVDDGVGVVTATLSGYGSHQGDTDSWTALAPAKVTLATLSGVDVTETGLDVTPDYLGVEYDAPAGGTAQARTGDSWGAFPKSFVDYQVGVGSASYWYSSGGSADVRKSTIPLQVVVPAGDAVAQPVVSTLGTSVRQGSYGTASTVTVAVRSASSATGKVTLKEGSKSYGTRSLAGGRTTFTLPKSLKPGKHTFTATYSGSKTVAASSSKAVVNVGKAAVGYKTSWTTKVKAGKRVQLKTVVVGKAGVAKPTGKVKVTFTRGKKSVVRWAGIQGGVAKVTLTGAQSKKLGKGKWTVKIGYTGNANYKAATGKRTVTAK